ncbi:MAG: hypothetical protein KF798_06600 [Candidatus Paracaedibacteraceae bacterium]|nr:hypothetical protein [Candidatus Paracaedibacteraceae bacterium]
MKKQSKDAAWQSTSQSVSYDENRSYCRFETDEEEGLIIKAADGIYVEFVVERYSHTEATDGKKPRTKEHSRLKDLPTAPGYEWLHEMDKRDDVIKIYVDERHDTMYMHQEGLSAVAKIVISIVMNYLTGGAFSLLTTVMTSLVTNIIEARGDFGQGMKKTLQ